MVDRCAKYLWTRLGDLHGFLPAVFRCKSEELVLKMRHRLPLHGPSQANMAPPFYSN